MAHQGLASDLIRDACHSGHSAHRPFQVSLSYRRPDVLACSAMSASDLNSSLPKITAPKSYEVEEVEEPLGSLSRIPLRMLLAIRDGSQ